MKKHIDEVRVGSVKGESFAYRNTAYYEINQADGRPNGIAISVVDVGAGEDEAKCTAELIAHCLNTHQMLLDALKEMMDMFVEIPSENLLYDWQRTARKAIEAAENVEIP